MKQLVEPFTINSDVNAVIENLENDTSTKIEWFNDNYFKMNVDKCHLLITNHADKCHLLITNHDADISVAIEGETIKGGKSVKFLGRNIDDKLDFTNHVSNVCKKIGHKLHALTRISHFMSTDELRMVMKAFIESQFGYCPLAWVFHSRTLNNRINQLH